MIERIAKIVCEKPWHLASSNQKRNAMITAKAVIEAMRDPPDDILRAGVRGFQKAYASEDSLSDWRACWNSALAEINVNNQ